MPSNTALSYQMMIEGAILGSMTRAADHNNFYIASAYGKAYCEFLGVPKEKYPEEPTHLKTKATFLASWELYYFQVLSVICNHINKKLEEVRREYRKNQDIPDI